MKVKIESAGVSLYEGDYDFLAIAAAVGVSKDTKETIPGSFAITLEPNEGNHTSTAKLLNYGSVALLKQGATVDVNFTDLRNQLTEKPSEVKGPWQIVFADTDSLLFALTVFRHPDLLPPNPKWPIKYPAAEADTPSDSYDDSQFISHYFAKVSANYLAQLTRTDPGSESCVILDAIRQRVGHALDIIKTFKSKITDEEKARRQIEKIKDEDKQTSPEAFAQLQAGEITLEGFRNAIREQKKSLKASANAAKRAASGKSTRPPSANKPLDEANKEKIAKAQAEIAAKIAAKNASTGAPLSTDSAPHATGFEPVVAAD